MKRFLVLGMVPVMALVLAPVGAYAMSPVLKEMEDGFVQIHEKVSPFVVNIETKGSVKADGLEMEQMDDLFRFFGIPNPEEGGPGMPPRSTRAQGSGFIYDAEGHIVTNNHVVEGAESIAVTLSTGEQYDAVVVGTDPDTDLAVIKIEPKSALVVAELVDSSTLKVGQFAIAVGSPRGFKGSFSFGHISALGRDDLRLPGLRFQDFIQTDAAINLGNSGGPLCNLDGQVIGINIAIVFGANSLGFAIPSNTAREIVPALISEKRIVRGYLGVGIVDVKDYADALELPDGKGAFVKSVQPGTPADRANLKPYDVIRKVNGEVVESASDLVRRISGITPGTKTILEVWREKAPIEAEVNIEEYAGSLKEATRGKQMLGLRVENLTPELAERLRIPAESAGVVVVEVESGSPAEDAGLTQGDVISEVAQQKIKDTNEFYTQLAANATPGKSVLIGYSRAGTSDITVIKVPADFSPK